MNYLRLYDSNVRYSIKKISDPYLFRIYILNNYLLFYNGPDFLRRLGI